MNDEQLGDVRALIDGLFDSRPLNPDVTAAAAGGRGGPRGRGTGIALPCSGTTPRADAAHAAGWRGLDGVGVRWRFRRRGCCKSGR